MFLKISQNLQENTCGLRNFQEHHFYRTPLDDCLWLFPATLLKWSTANSVWKTSDEYSLSRNCNARSIVQVHHFFLGSINCQCMFSLVYTIYSQKPPAGWSCYVKKGVLKNFINFIGKHMCWSLFNKVAGLTPILKNICQQLLLHCTRTTLCYFFVLLYIQHLPHHHCYYC